MPALLCALVLLFAAPARAQSDVAHVGSLDALGADLREGDEAARHKACLRIAEIGAPAKRLIPFLIALFENRDDRRHAAYALSRLGKAAHRPLLDRLTEAWAWTERRWAAAGLLWSTTPLDALLPGLLRVLAAERDGSVRAIVVNAVARVARHPKRVVPALTKALDDDHHPAAHAAWRALRGFGAAGWEARNAWRLKNLARLESPDLKTRVRAAAMAARTGDGDETCVRDALADALRSTKLTPAVKQQAMLGIGWSRRHGRWAIPFLLDALKNDRSWTAARALGQVAKGSKLEDDVVRALVRTAEGWTIARETAIRALARLASPRHVLAELALRKIARRTRIAETRAAAREALKAFRRAKAKASR